MHYTLCIDNVLPFLIGQCISRMAKDVSFVQKYGIFGEYASANTVFFWKK